MCDLRLGMSRLVSLPSLCSAEVVLLTGGSCERLFRSKVDTRRTWELALIKGFSVSISTPVLCKISIQ